MIFTTALLGAGLCAWTVLHGTPAAAMPGATNNSCWGQSVKAFADVDPGIIGRHSRASSDVTADPGDGGREGVGNVSKATGTSLSEGGQGEHANNNLMGVGLPACEGLPNGQAIP